MRGFCLCSNGKQDGLAGQTVYIANKQRKNKLVESTHPLLVQECLRVMLHRDPHLKVNLLFPRRCFLREVLRVLSRAFFHLSELPRRPVQHDDSSGRCCLEKQVCCVVVDECGGSRSVEGSTEVIRSSWRSARDRATYHRRRFLGSGSEPWWLKAFCHFVASTAFYLSVTSRSTFLNLHRRHTSLNSPLSIEQAFPHIAFSMSAEEDQQSQSGYEDGLAGGPGAPTPLSALEVRYLECCIT